ncbi:MAG TPA: hypothetical protein P5305_01325 [Rubrivivax sp.]|nr:hypothetical protein [Rubrivivax sp.]HRY86493.1 hypothetical protein [Rubrivivax sp.]
MKTIQMTPSQWAAVANNPIQRDTEAHAAKAARDHLARPAKTHQKVAAARLPDGSLVKLDGHTRSLMWGDGRLVAPPFVYVDVYDADSMGEVMELYKQYDYRGSVEGAVDKLSGAYRLHGISPSTALLTKGAVTTALRVIRWQENIYEMVGEWKPELLALDEIGATYRIMPTPIIVAALATLRVRGEKASSFWRVYVAGAGSRTNGASCGADALSRLVTDLRLRGVLASSKLNKDQAGKAISCCEAWINNRLMTGGVKATDLASYIERGNAVRMKLAA